MKQQQHRSEVHHDLRSVHKTSKIMKVKPLAAIAPSGPPQPKVYKVKPIHFRELVQKLTGAQPELLRQPTSSQSLSQANPRRSNFQAVAPPPLSLHPHQLQLQLHNQTDQTNISEKQLSCKLEQDHKAFSEKMMQNGVGTTELILSPNFQAWFSFAMLNPGRQLL